MLFFNKSVFIRCVMYQRFEELLKRDKIRASKVCKDLGIAPSTITDWKKGRYEPKADKLQAIADYFNVSFAYIKGWDEEAISECQEAINALNSYDLIRTGLAEYFEGIEFTDKEISMLIKQAKLIVESRN